MAFPESNSLRSTIADLKDIVSRCHGDETECVRLLSQIEALVMEIERKSPQGPAVSSAAARIVSL